jgi:uncharacterized protein (TIGR03437 family)
MYPKAACNGYLPSVGLLLAIVLLPIGATAQSYSIPGGSTVVFTGDWPAEQVPTVLAAATQLWPQMQQVAQSTGSQWTIAYQAQSPSSDPCQHASWLSGQLDLLEIGHHLSLAMFTVCQFAKTDLSGAYTEGQASAKAVLTLRELARTGAGIEPVTSMAAISSNFSQRYFAAGGATNFAENGGNRDAIGAVFELFAARLGGNSPTLAPLDAAWAQVSVPSDFTGRADQFMPAFLTAADSLLGKIANRSASAWLKSSPAAFALDASQRASLGFSAAGDSTDGLWMEAYWLGAIPGWSQSPTVVNPTTVRVVLKQRVNGVTTAGGARTAKLRILDVTGTAEIFSSNLAISSGSGTLSIPSAVIAGMTDGAYPAESCILMDDGKSCEPQQDQYQHIVIDHSGWTAGKLVVIANGPLYPALQRTTLKLAPGQAWSLKALPGAVAIGDLPTAYAEVNLTDGTATRTFPWMPDVPAGNIWTWTLLDDPNVLSMLGAATFQPSLAGASYQVTPNAWYALATAGGTPGDAEFTATGANGFFPFRACDNEYGGTTVVFSSKDQTWNAPMNYCSWGQVNILSPSTLPAGETVSMRLFRNGTGSNILSAIVSPAGPSIFVADAGRQLGTVVFATGPQAGRLVTPELPAHVGDIVSIYYTGCGPLSETLEPGQPAPTDHLVYATLPISAMIGDAPASVPFNGLAPGFAGLCQLNLIVPAPVSGAVSWPSTTKMSTIHLSMAGQDANQLLLPIVFEPNGSYLGNPDAKVTMLQFGDYQCPFCDEFFRDTWPRVKSEYVDTGKVRFLFQDLAFLGPDSTTSAMAAHCAGDQYRFWQYHDYLYAHQGNENNGWGAPDHQKQFAAIMGLNAGQFSQCLDSGKYFSEVQSENADARSRSITSVPTFLINATRVVGAQPLAVFEQAINAALAHP